MSRDPFSTNTTIHIPEAVSSTQNAVSNVLTIPYNYSGNLVVSQSAPICPVNTLIVSALSATLLTASSSGDVVITLLVNNEPVGIPVSLPAGVTYLRVPQTGVTIRGGLDTYAVSITSIGTGAGYLGGEIEVTK